MDSFNSNRDNQNPYQNSPQYNNTSNNRPPSFPNQGQGLATAAFMLAVGAVATFLTIYLPIILASLAIVLALLSKGYGKKLLGSAKAAIVCGIGTLTILVAIFISTITMIFANPDVLVEFGKNYDTMWEQIYGQPSEEMTGISFEAMMENYSDTIKELK